MEVTLTLTLIVTCLILFVFIFLAFVKGRAIKKLRHIRGTDETQRCFGEARHELMLLVRNNKLNPESATFRFFYYFDTLIMRNPEQYRELAKKMQESLFGAEGTDHRQSSALYKQVLIESADWNQECRRMVMTQANAIYSLVILHSSVFRLTMSLTRAFIKDYVPLKLRKSLITFLKNVAFKTRPEVETFWETKAEFDKLAHAA